MMKSILVGAAVANAGSLKSAFTCTDVKSQATIGMGGNLYSDDKCSKNFGTAANAGTYTSLTCAMAQMSCKADDKGNVTIDMSNKIDSQTKAQLAAGVKGKKCDSNEAKGLLASLNKENKCTPMQLIPNVNFGGSVATADLDGKGCAGTASLKFYSDEGKCTKQVTGDAAKAQAAAFCGMMNTKDDGGDGKKGGDNKGKKGGRRRLDHHGKKPQDSCKDNGDGTVSIMAPMGCKCSDDGSKATIGAMNAAFKCTNTMGLMKVGETLDKVEGAMKDCKWSSASGAAVFGAALLAFLAL